MSSTTPKKHTTKAATATTTATNVTTNIATAKTPFTQNESGVSDETLQYLERCHQLGTHADERLIVALELYAIRLDQPSNQPSDLVLDQPSNQPSDLVLDQPSDLALDSAGVDLELSHRWGDLDMCAGSKALRHLAPCLVGLRWPSASSAQGRVGNLRRGGWDKSEGKTRRLRYSRAHHGEKLTPFGWELLARLLPHLQHLQTLVVPHQGLDDDTFAKYLLAPLSGSKTISHVGFPHNHLSVEIVQRLEKSTWFQLRSASASSTGSASASKKDTKKEPDLTLDLSNNWLGYRGTHGLRDAAASRKKIDGYHIELHLDGNHVYEEAFNFLTHFIGFVSALFAFNNVTTRATEVGTPEFMISGYLFGVSLLMMFASSSLFHIFFRMSTLHRFFQKMDHASIYCLIAGSYTPYLLIALADSTSSFPMFLFQWGFCLFGVILSLTGSSKFMRSLSCMLMGWSIVLSIQEVYQKLHPEAFFWLVAGGLFYSVGVIFYTRKGAFNHGIWHLFVMGGAFSHYWSIYNYVMH